MTLTQPNKHKDLSLAVCRSTLAGCETFETGRIRPSGIDRLWTGSSDGETTATGKRARVEGGSPRQVSRTDSYATQSCRVSGKQTRKTWRLPAGPATRRYSDRPGGAPNRWTARSDQVCEPSRIRTLHLP